MGYISTRILRYICLNNKFPLQTNECIYWYKNSQMMKLEAKKGCRQFLVIQKKSPPVSFISSPSRMRPRISRYWTVTWRLADRRENSPNSNVWRMLDDCMVIFISFFPAYLLRITFLFAGINFGWCNFTRMNNGLKFGARDRGNDYLPLGSFPWSWSKLLQ